MDEDQFKILKNLRAGSKNEYSYAMGLLATERMNQVLRTAYRRGQQDFIIALKQQFHSNSAT